MQAKHPYTHKENPQQLLPTIELKILFFRSRAMTQSLRVLAALWWSQFGSHYTQHVLLVFLAAMHECTAHICMISRHSDTWKEIKSLKIYLVFFKVYAERSYFILMYLSVLFKMRWCFSFVVLTSWLYGLLEEVLLLLCQFGILLSAFVLKCISFLYYISTSTDLWILRVCLVHFP